MTTGRRPQRSSLQRALHCRRRRYVGLAGSLGSGSLRGWVWRGQWSRLNLNPMATCLSPACSAPSPPNPIASAGACAQARGEERAGCDQGSARPAQGRPARCGRPQAEGQGHCHQRRGACCIEPLTFNACEKSGKRFPLRSLVANLGSLSMLIVAGAGRPDPSRRSDRFFSYGILEMYPASTAVSPHIQISPFFSPPHFCTAS